jgi:sortase A
MREGDLFYIRVLDEVLTYEVDKILIVEPHEVDSLMVKKGKDYCTLFTCTPYGVNSHRLLVRGHRIETEKEKEVTLLVNDAVIIKPIIVAPLLAVPMLFLLLIWILLPKRKSKRRDQI